MTTVDFITELFSRIDDSMKDAKKHTQANLYPSEVVTIAMLFALKGVGNRPFYRWLKRDYLNMFQNAVNLKHCKLKLWHCLEKSMMLKSWQRKP